MLEVEDVGKIVPGYDKSGLSALLHKFYPPEKETLGVVVFEIVPLIN
ncbi:MAG: hypothetical protein KBB88_01185 [Candidatus Pacebacteria bacterium]|nr:hypothetical protein [Candidatus Paceibacterota bacterium]